MRYGGSSGKRSQGDCLYLWCKLLLEEGRGRLLKSWAHVQSGYGDAGWGGGGRLTANNNEL